MKLLNIYLNYRFKKHVWGKNPQKDKYWANIGLDFNHDFAKIMINPKEHYDKHISLAHYLCQNNPNSTDKIIDNLITHNTWPNLGENKRDDLWTFLLLSQSPLSLNNLKKTVDHITDTHMDLTGYRVMRKVLPILMERESFENMVKSLEIIKDLYITTEASISLQDEYLFWLMNTALYQSANAQTESLSVLKEQVSDYVTLIDSLKEKIDSCDLIRAWFKVKMNTPQKNISLSISQKIILNGVVQIFQSGIEDDDYDVPKTLIDTFMSKADEKLYKNKPELSLRDIVERDFYLSKCGNEVILKDILSLKVPKTMSPVSLKKKRL